MKQPKIYSSYEEINRDLAIYKLEKEICLIKIQNDVEQIKEGLTVKRLITGFLGIDSEGEGGNWFSRTFMTILPFTLRTAWKMFRK